MNRMLRRSELYLAGMRAAVIALLLGILLGCTSAPLTVPLGDFDVGVPPVWSDTRSVVFVKREFRPPPVNIKYASLEGSLTYQSGDISLHFYAADSEPCPPAHPGVYICDRDDPDIQPVGSASFQTGATQPLRLSGSRITSGINRGNLWIGVRLDRGVATAGTLQFRNMVARVAVLP
jgi:hypothetical protein